MTLEIEKIYNPKKTEDKWYTLWEKSGYFKASPNPKKKSFVIVIPPPNVTAALHMGHAYNNTIQDILIRWKRMQGYEALYQPGTDHAGIATQVVVEKSLEREKKTRHSLGREAFVRKVWQWKEHYGNKISTQLKKLGISADWSRERFTLDKELSKVVQKVFIDLYNDGLIYRGNRIVNWDPVSETALSDDEVEHKEVQAMLYHLKYKVVNSDQFITVATTRPETLFGDTGIAVPINDPKKKTFIGNHVLIPFVNRKVPIVSDKQVDKDFGSGFVKITPAHDPNDFEMGQRHQLPQLIIMDKKAHILPQCMQMLKDGTSRKVEQIPKEFVGLNRYQAREKVIEELKKLGQLEKIEHYTHSVGHSYRSQAVIEPYLSKQWFVLMKPLVQKALDAVQNGTIKFQPQGRYEKTYEHWMTSIKDWCISRQLWWGHRIPAWYNSTGEMKVCIKNPSTKTEKWIQENDVLDTWFSSWLWPFSTMGWPQKSHLFNYFYPTSVLVTGADIIFFWVARMIMASYQFTGKPPFHTVYFNGIVRDKNGKKMSKSLKNGIDPLDMIDAYSTDAVRYTLIQLSAQGQDIQLSKKSFEMGRNFSNKVWNAYRFIAMQLPKRYLSLKPYLDNLELSDRWILNELQNTITKVTEGLGKYRFQDAQNSIYTFFWNFFCDWYLELIKNRLYKPKKTKDKETALAVASHILKQSMILLHPFTPFITEEIWQAFRTEKDKNSIMISPWATTNKKLIDNISKQKMAFIQRVIIRIRHLRKELNIPLKKSLQLYIYTEKESSLEFLQENILYFSSLAGINNISYIENKNFKKEKGTTTFLIDNFKFQIPLQGIIDTVVEKRRIEVEIIKKENLLKKIQKKLDNKMFLDGAPVHIVEHEKKKKEEIQETITKLKESIKIL